MGKPVDNSCCNHFQVEQHRNMVATVTYRLCYMYVCCEPDRFINGLPVYKWVVWFVIRLACFR